MLEMCRIYAGTRKEDGTEEPLQYADLAEWQSEQVESDEAQRGRAFWRERFDAEAFRQRLPGLPPGSAAFAAERVDLEISGRQFASLQTLVRKVDRPLPAVLLAVVLVLLRKLRPQRIQALGVGYDGRPFDELVPVIGALKRFAPLTVALDSTLRFTDVVERVSEELDQGRRWQEVFEWGSSGDNRPSTSMPCGFEFEEMPLRATAGSTIFRLVRPRDTIERFDVKFGFILSAEGLTGCCEYDGSVLRAGDARRLAERFQATLERVTDHPEATLGDLAILGHEERRQLLLESRGKELPYSQDCCLHQLIERQVAARPDRVAVVCDGQQLTYAELDARAAELSRHLESLGVEAGVMVGLCVERSLHLVIGILGILKAGGAYVPLDPGYPRDRTAFMLADTRASVLLTEQRLLGILPAHGGHTVCLDARLPGRLDSSRPLAPTVSADDPAYVIYTSGSTGRPKGVVVTHRNAVHSTEARIDYYAEGVDRFLLVSSFAFDSSVAGIFWTLAQGGTLVLPPQGSEQDPASLARLVESWRISHVLSLPSLYRLLISHSPSLQSLQSLRTVIVAGEVCPPELSVAHHAVLPKTRLFNEYGPTEATVWSSVYRIAGPLRDTHVPIGRPIANSRVYVLDERLQLCPIGVAGELYVGGPGVARGYLNAPALTAERFVADPLDAEPGSRLYRTGDLGRYGPDGNLEFLGRADDQVKVRGYRIELGEIEAALATHPAIREAAVVALGAGQWNGSGQDDAPSADREPAATRLAAYVVAEQKLTVADLRAFLADRLPDYMLPAAFVTIETLPRTPNGKVDRRALPPPGTAKLETERVFVAPRNRFEQVLAETWQRVLGVERVGIHDNYFELGGDSILSLQIVARANQAGLSITPMQVFQYQTIAELAEHAATPAPRTITAEQGDVVGEVPLTPIQRWFCERASAPLDHWNIPLLLELNEPVSREHCEQAAQALLRHHDALRLRLGSGDDGPRQEIARADATSALVEWVDLSDIPAERQAAEFERSAAQWQASLSLKNGPLMRMIVYQRGPDRKPLLLWVLHHLSCDVVSWRILMEDLQTALDQLGRGKAIELPPKSTSFKHWAERLQAYSNSPQVSRHADFWARQTTHTIPQVPVDFADGRDRNTERSSRRLTAALDREDTHILLHDLPRTHDAQVQEVLLTALLAGFADWTGRWSLLVDVESHGREEGLFEDVDLSRTVGWFTTYCPVVLSAHGSAGLEAALDSVKQQLHDVPDRGFSYGLLRWIGAEVEIARPLRNCPKAEVNFNYLGQLGAVGQDFRRFEWAPRDLSCGLDHDPSAERSHLIEVVAWVLDERLHIEWSYAGHAHRHETIERLAEGFVRALRTLTEGSRRDPARRPTAADRPGVAWDKPHLDAIEAAIQKARERV
jgi:amino acid adenylation domain-containing protein/non-ribosomal peptide synthase protein (TIGR01720 family)